MPIRLKSFFVTLGFFAAIVCVSVIGYNWPDVLAYSIFVICLLGTFILVWAVIDDEMRN
jgi:hypothetical protein